MSNQPENARELEELQLRDEILQVFYWYQGEGFGESVSVHELLTFLPSDENKLYRQLEILTEQGYLKHEVDTVSPRYSFTSSGLKEGGRRFADEFSGLLAQGHGECGPDCPECKGKPRDSCLHCSTVEY